MAIAHVSDTARWVAIYRALESERADALFRDPFARRLAGAAGEALGNELDRKQQMAWAMVVRTQVIDEEILAAVGGGVELIVNLGAGLDARPWRLELPAALRWVDIDLPAILDYKLAALAGETPRCRYQAIPADLTRPERRELFATLAASCKRALILSEGLLIYLPDTEVAALARDLAAYPSFEQWLFDLIGPALLTMMRRSLDRDDPRREARFYFAPAEGTKFFEPLGWRERRFYSTLEEGRRLHREMRFAWLMRWAGRLGPRALRQCIRRMSGIVRLERAGV